ncbi:sigma-70 family RNA polymerase sigma factor [bacterium]|nr:sigma-70 family RNA polymerase sigma factor [bacterium]
MDKSEMQLIKAAINGDRKAQAKIVSDNEQMVYNLSLKLLGNPDDAENILQETFLKVLKSLDTFKGQSSLSTWIYRIATNYGLMHLRKKKRVFVPIEDYPIDQKQDYSNFYKINQKDPMKDALNSELKEKLDEAVEKLSPKFKTVFMLKDIEGLSLKEISDILDISLPAVKSNLHRARVFLRNELADYLS